MCTLGDAGSRKSAAPCASIYLAYKIGHQQFWTRRTLIELIFESMTNGRNSNRSREKVSPSHEGKVVFGEPCVILPIIILYLQ